MRRFFPFRSRPAIAALLLASLIAAGLATAPSSSSAAPSLLLSAKIRMRPGTCASGLTACSDADTYGLTDPDGHVFYYIYLVAAGFDTSTGVQEVNVGIDYDRVSNSGVDVYSWSLCADSDSASSVDWLQQGGSNRIRWGSKSSDSLAVAGYFYVAAYSSGYLALVPPAGLDATIKPFAGQEQTIPTSSLGYVGFGGFAGCNPCLGGCQYTAVQTSTWSSLKLLYKSR